MKYLHPFPILVAWGIWLAQNSGIFEGKAHPTFKISQQAMAMLSNFKYVPKGIKNKAISEVSIDKSMAWGFFDGACQGESGTCGLGFVLHFSNCHYITGKLIWVKAQITKESFRLSSNFLNVL
jgi:hypothetical protein